MAKDGYETYGLGDTIDPILPEGWSEGDDLFADAVTEREIFEPDEAQSSNPVVEENEPEESLEDLLPTTESDTGDGAAAEEDDDADVSDGTDEPIAPPSRILRMKVNHKEYDVDVNNMTDEELLERLQKADAFDAMKDSQLKEKFRQVYEDQISQGMTDGVARMVASNATGGKTYNLEDGADDDTDSEPVAKTSDPEPVKDFRAQVKQLKAIFPDFKSMPTEVMTAYENGADLMSAYSAYRVREAEKASQAVKKENRILKQNAASAAKAPVRGVSGGGATGVKKENPFLKGFDSDRW
jgi:hypothetical protein